MTGVPPLINSCEFDPVYGAEKQKAGDEILGDGKTEGPAYKTTYWPGCTHGFAVRGDVNDPLVKAGREGVFKATVVGSLSTFEESDNLEKKCLLNELKASLTTYVINWLCHKTHKIWSEKCRCNGMHSSE